MCWLERAICQETHARGFMTIQAQGSSPPPLLVLIDMARGPPPPPEVCPLLETSAAQHTLFTPYQIRELCLFAMNPPYIWERNIKSHNAKRARFIIIKTPEMFDDKDLSLPSPRRVLICAKHTSKLCVSQGCSPVFSCANKVKVSPLRLSDWCDVPCSCPSYPSSALLCSNPVSKPCSRLNSPAGSRPTSPMLAPCSSRTSCFACSRPVSPAHSNSNSPHSRPVSPPHSRPPSPSKCQRSISTTSGGSRPVCTSCLLPFSGPLCRPISPCSRSVFSPWPKPVVPRKHPSVTRGRDKSPSSQQDSSLQCKLYIPCRDCHCHRVWTTAHGRPASCSKTTLCRNCPCHNKKSSPSRGRKSSNVNRPRSS